MSQLSRRGLLKTGAAAGVIAATGLPAKSAAKRGWQAAHRLERREYI